MVFQEDPLVEKITELYEKISTLETLKPSQDVNTLFTELVLTCMPPSPIDVSNLSHTAQQMRSNLISLCGQAECLLESHFSTLLASFQYPLDHLTIFPYYPNYLKLSLLEFTILTQHLTNPNVLPSRVAFVGSGPLPLTSLVLASNHLTTTTFHNYDVDPLANSMASKLVSSHLDLSKRMVFHTANIVDVGGELGQFDVVFLAALVGVDREEKARVIGHLAKYMAPGAILMLRSAHGARAFLYPVVDPSDLVGGFEVLSVFHPVDEVINSVVIARKVVAPRVHEPHQGLGPMIMPSKCCDHHIHQGFNSQLNMLEELAVEEQHS